MEKIIHEKNIEQWSSVAEKYHDIRLTPPTVIVKIILSWLKREPDVVVDIGCGTGLSTIIWNDFAKNIIGIEPNADMRMVAERKAGSDRIIYKDGLSNQTNLPSDYADVITVSQAFHWMDIDSSLLEFYKVLKPGGVLAIFDADHTPIIDWEIEKAFYELRSKCSEIVYSQESPPVHNDKSTYNERIKAFGKFRYSRAIECHSVNIWNRQRITASLIQQANGDFAIKIDASIKKYVDDFWTLVESKCGDAVEIINPYKIVLAVK